MSRHSVLLKVYGNLSPADDALFRAAAGALSDALPAPEDPPVELEGDLLRISFEGVYCPVDDLLACLSARLSPQSEGKLDILDLEAWTLTRHAFHGGIVHSGTRPLNDVLAYSGH